MTPQSFFYILIGIIVLEFIWDTLLNCLNAQHFKDPIPSELDGIFDEKEYHRSQEYKNVNYHFTIFKSFFHLVVLLLFFSLDGFAYLDEITRSYLNNELMISMLYIGILLIGNSFLDLPFSYYETFFIEEKFGFNKTTMKTFWLDHLKGLVMSIVLGGIIFFAILWFYHQTRENFWWYTWVLITLFTVFFTLFYSNLIVPLFNKQTPLESGELRSLIENAAVKMGFKLDNIFVIDGSKRSTKANAYFTGFGPKKRVVLYDTLIQDLEPTEIAAVLAHEIGHYKKGHIIYQLLIGVLTTGFTLYLLSLFISSPQLSQALGVAIPSFHIGMISFGILYSPISEITGFFMSILSRKFEYQADAFAKKNYAADPLINALKKMSKKSLSNLTPHPLYVFWHYSHPTLTQRINRLKK